MENNQGIYKAIPAIMSELNAIGKNSKNIQQNYNFRSIDDVTNALKPLLSKHGVFIVPTFLNSERMDKQTRNGGTMYFERVQYAFDFFASDGSSFRAIVQSEGMDSADKSSNKALMAAFKYLVITVFCINTADNEDADSTTPDLAPAGTAKRSETAREQIEPETEPVVTSSDFFGTTAGDGKRKKYPGDEEFLRTFELPRRFSTDLTLEEARAIKGSDRKTYGSKSLEELYYMLYAIGQQISNNGLSDAEKIVANRKSAAIIMLVNERKQAQMQGA